MSYSDDWLNFTRRYARQRLMTEDGWDRIAATEVGFDGSVLTGAKVWDPTHIRWGESSRGNTAFGAGNWEPYPLGVWLFHDKVLFYHHDLDHSVLNPGLEVLTWDCAFGVMGGYLWPGPHGSKPEWIATVNAFQPAVLARLAGRQLTSYRELAPDVTESSFGELSTVANWNADRPYEMGRYAVAPSGCLIRSTDGNLLAGVFVNQFNGESLTEGLHYLVVERRGEAFDVRQPVGNNTSLSVPVPADWTHHKVEVLAVDRKGQSARTDGTLQRGKVRFYYSPSQGNLTVDHYEIRKINIKFM